MSINNSYFDVTISNGTFRIVESSSKPQNQGSSVATLRKIDRVLKEGLKYEETTGNYANLSPEKLCETLKAKAAEIHTGYQNKSSKSWTIFHKFLSSEKEVNALHKSIAESDSKEIPHQNPL